MKKINKNILGFVLVAVVGVSLLGFNIGPIARTTNPNNSTASISDTTSREFQKAAEDVPCINSFLAMPPAYHIHPTLEIVIDGKKRDVEKNIGISASCEKVLHTHDTSGEIHIEPNYEQVFTLGQFFALWQQPFSASELMEKTADATHEIVMTIDGQLSTEFEKLILKDKQQIKLEYREKNQPPATATTTPSSTKKKSQ